MYHWISHNGMSSHSRNELKSHSQTAADMNFQMHKTTEASFPTSRITISGFDSICVKGPQERSLLSMTIMPCPRGPRVILKKLSLFQDMSVLTWMSEQDLNSNTGRKSNN